MNERLRLMGIDPNSKFLAYVILDDKRKMISSGNIAIELMSFDLARTIKDHQVNALAIESYACYGKILNKHHFATIENIGRVLQFADDHCLPCWKYTRPEIIYSLGGARNISEGQMQAVMKLYLGLKEELRPEHINAAACVAAYAINKLQQEDLSERIIPQRKDV